MVTRSVSPVPRRPLSAVTAGFATLALGAAALGLAAQPSQATHTTNACESAEFSLSANLKPPNFVGHLTRGPSSAPQPAYFVNSFGGFFMANDIVVFSQSGAGCQVDLEVLNLPTGVSSQMPTTLTVRSSGVGDTDLALQAESDAGLGEATVTVRATLGDQMRTLDLPITVEDQPDLVVPSSTVLSDSEISAGVLTNTADGPTTVELSSSEPDVVQVPGTVTIPARFSSGTFEIDVQSLRGRSETVVITATLGDVSDSFLLTVARR